MFKAGANKVEVSQIAKMAGRGDSAKRISKDLKIEQGVVEKFMPKDKKKKGGR